VIELTFEYTLQKVLDLKKRQKEELQQQYSEAMNTFETVATKLYHLLKQREKLEEQAREKIAVGTSIHELQQREMLIVQLHQEIQQQQRATSLARERMDKKHRDLQVISIELKKYEKMKQQKQERFLLEEKKREQQIMDELSVQAFAFRV
jgi:flagellar FliJ protein